ncbi:type IV pilus twitching motility protein PilT [Salinibacterium sp. NG253]|uniref:type IV pilus twitching motility protein PilT n=1 Tax=Salinibacterium sp. NG253 TaxID=2792039 RepID=UPI00272D3CDC|nr:type IV pilus twitching motility protein PilT [Salinibacterium sp. NG253]
MAKRIYDIPSQSVDESLFTPKGQSAPSAQSVPSDAPPPTPGTSVPGVGSPQASAASSSAFPEWAQTGAAPSASAATVPASPLPTIPPPSGSINSTDTSAASAPPAPPTSPAPAPAPAAQAPAEPAATPSADAAAEGGRRARRMATEPVTSIDSLDELFRQAAAGAMSQTSAATSAAGASMPAPEAPPVAEAPPAAPAPSPTAAEVPYFTEDASDAGDSPTEVLNEVPMDPPTMAFPPPSAAAEGGLLDLPDIAPEADDSLNFPPPGVDEGLLSFTSGFGAAEPTPSRESQLLSVPEIVEEAREARPDMELTAREGSNPELLDALKEVVYTGASDLHISSGAVPMIRVDGGLQPLKGMGEWDKERTRNALFSILDQKQEEQFLEVLELDFAFELSEAARFRVNFYMDRGNLGAAFRIIPTEIKQLKDLGIQESVGKFAGLPRGLVLVTGPTGSGKSTTLAALIDLVNRTRADHIVTVEDPIEFLHGNQKSLVNQREVGRDTHSFTAALKHVLRQDPDVILIGELRDLETISIALTAAETGHLVFATLHTQDAAQTVDRIIDVFPPHQQGQVRTQLAAVLQGIVCQTLVRRASGKGRVAATEVLTMTPAIGNLIREGKIYQIPSAMQAGRGGGMHTMDQHLAGLAKSGAITEEAALAKSHDPEGMHRLMSDNSTGVPR